MSRAGPDFGVVVGTSDGAAGGVTAFIYDGVMRPIFTGGGDSMANGINNRGQIVGLLAYRGFLLDGGRLTMLDTLPVVPRGWTMLSPQAINDRGWIVGVGTDPHSFYHGFLLIPPGS